MKKLSYTLLASLGLVFLVACGGSKSKIKNDTGAGVNVCPPLYVMGPNGCVPQQGLSSDAVRGKVSYIMERGHPQNAGYGQFQITNEGLFREFIRKAMQVCDRSTYTQGVYDCDAWTQGYFSMMLTFDGSLGSQVGVQFSGTPVNYGYNYEFGFFPETFGVSRNPMILGMSAHDDNESKGFSMRSYGYGDTEAYRSEIKIEVPVGKVTTTASSLEVKLYFEKQLMAQGTLQRCYTVGCGIFSPGVPVF